VQISVEVLRKAKVWMEKPVVGTAAVETGSVVCGIQTGVWERSERWVIHHMDVDERVSAALIARRLMSLMTV
jgi:hypothetical protein